MTKHSYPTPDELRAHARQEIEAVAEDLKRLSSDINGVDRLSTMLDRADAANITSRLANARADLVAAHVHELMRGGGAEFEGAVSRGQAIGIVMLRMNRLARNGVARPLTEAERRWNLPEGYENTPRSMSLSQRILAGLPVGAEKDQS